MKLHNKLDFCSRKLNFNTPKVVKGNWTGKVKGRTKRFKGGYQGSDLRPNLDLNCFMNSITLVVLD